MTKRQERTIEVKCRIVKLRGHKMPDGSYYVCGRFARAVFVGEGDTFEAAADKAEADAREFERTYTH